MKGEAKYGDLDGTWTAEREAAKPKAASIGAPAATIERTTFPYATKGQQTLHLDRIVAPAAKAAGKRPVVIFSHGGGWEGGGRNDAGLVPFLDHLASLGYTVISIDYRLGIKEAKAKKEITSTNGVEMYLRAIEWGVEDLFDPGCHHQGLAHPHLRPHERRGLPGPRTRVAREQGRGETGRHPHRRHPSPGGGGPGLPARHEVALFAAVRLRRAAPHRRGHLGPAGRPVLAGATLRTARDARHRLQRAGGEGGPRGEHLRPPIRQVEGREAPARGGPVQVPLGCRRPVQHRPRLHA